MKYCKILILLMIFCSVLFSQTIQSISTIHQTKLGLLARTGLPYAGSARSFDPVDSAYVFVTIQSHSIDDSTSFQVNGVGFNFFELFTVHYQEAPLSITTIYSPDSSLTNYEDGTAISVSVRPLQHRRLFMQASFLGFKDESFNYGLAQFGMLFHPRPQTILYTYLLTPTYSKKSNTLADPPSSEGIMGIINSPLEWLTWGASVSHAEKIQTQQKFMVGIHPMFLVSPDLKETVSIFLIRSSKAMWLYSEEDQFIADNILGTEIDYALWRMRLRVHMAQSLTNSNHTTFGITLLYGG